MHKNLDDYKLRKTCSLFIYRRFKLKKKITTLSINCRSNLKLVLIITRRLYLHVGKRSITFQSNFVNKYKTVEI